MTVTFEQTLQFYETLALELAKSSGTAVTAGPDGNGIYDGFEVLTYLDIQGAVNVDTNTTGYITPAMDAAGESGDLAANSSTNYGDFTLVSRGFRISNSKTVSRISASRSTAMNGCKVMILHRDSAGIYDVLAKEDFDHPGGGEVFKTLETPTVIPATGDFYAAVYSPSHASNWDVLSSSDRAYLNSEANGSALAMTENLGTCPVLRVGYVGEVQSLMVETKSVTLDGVPDWGRVTAIVDENGAAMNTDIVFSISRDGDDFRTITMSERYKRPDGSSVFTSGSVDLSQVASGMHGRVRFQTHNQAYPKFLSVGYSFGLNN